MQNNGTSCFILNGDSRNQLKHFAKNIDLIVTSPPYADARKKHYDSIHPDHFADWFMTFHEYFWNALKDTGSLVINIKDKVVDGRRHRFVWETILRLEKEGWFCIDDYIWHKTNPMPGYWPTRLRDGWEYCFHLAKQKKPYISQDSVKIPIGNWTKARLKNPSKNDLKRSNSSNESGLGRDLSKWIGKQTVLPSNVISLPLVGRNKKHPAVFPVELPEFFIKLLCPEKGIVLDPFAGSGSTGVAAIKQGMNCILVDKNMEYSLLSEQRIINECSEENFVINTNFKNEKYLLHDSSLNIKDFLLAKIQKA